MFELEEKESELVGVVCARGVVEKVLEAMHGEAKDVVVEMVQAIVVRTSDR